MDILERVKQIREAKGMSVYELADKCGIARNTIYRWYTKSYTPTLETIKVICEKGFNMSLAEFFAVDCDLVPVTQDTKEFLDIWLTLNDQQKQALKQILLTFKK